MQIFPGYKCKLGFGYAPTCVKLVKLMTLMNLENIVKHSEKTLIILFMIVMIFSQAWNNTQIKAWKFKRRIIYDKKHRNAGRKQLGVQYMSAMQ